MKYQNATQQQGDDLADIRAAAMQPSLEAVGRFDANRVRSRFLDTFVPNDTTVIVEQES